MPQTAAPAPIAAPMLDLEWVRRQFPALSGPWAFCDNAGGSQTLGSAIEQVAEYLRSRDVQLGGSYEISQQAAAALAQGRAAAALWTNAARPEEIVFGGSSTQLIVNLAWAMRRQFAPGDEILLCRGDHESNIGPWVRLEEFGLVIRWWEPRADGSLALEDLDALLGPKTRLVCVHHVSNILGQINPIAEIAARAHAVGAQICVDGVAYAPHRAIDVQAWDVDYYIFSIYKCYGPHTAVMYGKYDLLCALDGLYHYFYGAEAVPAKLEPGNPNYELNYAISAITDYLCALGRQAGGQGGDRAALEQGFAAITAQEDALTDRLLGYLDAHPRITLIGPGENRASLKVPTIAFRIEGVNSQVACLQTDGAQIAMRHGDFHSRRLVEHLGQTHEGGLLRLSMLHYNSLDELERVIAQLDRIAG